MRSEQPSQDVGGSSSGTGVDRPASGRTDGRGASDEAPGAPALEGYRIERQIGRGASATVYLAREVKHDRLVAIKVLHPALGASILAERFLREIAIIARLAHPNILPLLDSGRAGEQLYYVTPYVPGESLRRRLERESRLGAEDAVRLTREVADALDYAHRQGLVHRDVKPENILLADGHALVADFGIARALSLAVDDRLTSAGFSPGTPRYMSPEQATGAPDVDGRSDIYSLGCVLYELLSGAPPFAGAAPPDVVAMHRSATVPTLRAAGVVAPAAVEDALVVALAKRPDDRFATAAAFAAALGGARVGPDTARRVTRVVGAWRQRLGRQTLGRQRLGMAGLAALGVGTLAWSLAWPFGDRGVVRPGASGPVPDTTRVAVFPVKSEGLGAAQLDVAALLNEAIDRWSGVTPEDQFRVSEAVDRLGSPTTASRASAVAASLGSGRFILVRASRQRDSLTVYASLYETVGGRDLASVSETVPDDPSTAKPAFARMVQQLLLRGSGPDSLLAAASGGMNLPLAQAFDGGQRSLSRWNLGEADSLFQLALSFDPSDARANLWTAQVRLWRGRPTDEWSVLAARAAAAATNLSVRDQAYADALLLLARGEYAQACAVYDRLRRANERDFGAWYGLGECRSRDNAVVRDSSSPSGWRMRSSYGAAVRAYDRALDLLPSTYAGYEHDAFNGLSALLFVRTRLVSGRAIAPDTMQFLARLGVIGDSLALVPYPWHVASAGGSASLPPGFRAAEAIRTREFRKLAAAWSAAFPNRAGPKQAVAIALEMLGDASAVDTLQLARRLASEPDHALRLAAKEVMLRAKFADPDHAEGWQLVRAMADSLIAKRVTGARVAEALQPIAALTGRCGLAERLSRLSESSGALPINPHLQRSTALYLARATLGCRAGDTGLSLGALVRRRDQERVATDLGVMTDVFVLLRPALLTWPVDSSLVERLAAGTPSQLLIVALRAWARHDVAGSRAVLDTFVRQWDAGLGAPTPDIALPTARLMAAVGDTLGAIEALDQTLSGVRSYDPWMMDDEVVVGALVGAMALRADLANARGDVRSARQWGGIVAALWSGADAELQSVVRRMERYVQRR